MRMLDLFSGIGGFSLAAQWVWGNELDIVGFCEQDDFCQKVLNKHWPNVPIYDDIFNLKGNQFEAIDIITGGFPCQPFSSAGKRKGKEDDRYLWEEMFRIITETNPRWVVGENVVGIIELALDDIISQMESAGYETQAYIIPACGVGAEHRRDRIWIVANSYGANGNIQGENNSIYKSRYYQSFSGKRFKNDRILPESRMDRTSDGVSDRVDRLRALGNAIVPQVAQVIMQAIKEIDKMEDK